MTYRINPEIRKIHAPVIIRWNGEYGNSDKNLAKGIESAEFEFQNGEEACDHVFDRHFNTKCYCIKDGKIEIQVYEFLEPSLKRG